MRKGTSQSLEVQSAQNVPGPGKDTSQMSLNQMWISMMGPGYPGCFLCGAQPPGVRTSLREGAPVPAEKPPLPQVKKLVYVYLVRYAEEQQDLALLSISTFQRGLKVRGLHLPPWGLGLDGALLEVWTYSQPQS